MLGEDDLALVHALQVQPRAAWADLAVVLACTPTTAAHRWERLTASGATWVTAVPGPRCSGCVTFVGLHCAPGQREAVAAELARDAAAVTVEITIGSWDLLIEVITPDLAAFGAYLLDRIERLPGVTGTQTFLATTVVTEASRWRLGALDSGQSSALARNPGTEHPTRPSARHLSTLDRQLLAALGHDGRQSWQRLAELLGTSAATARRRTERLLATGEAALRCDVSAPLFGRPLTASLWGRVPAAELPGVARSLATVPGMRFVASIAGAYNLLCTVWLSSAEEIQRLEDELAQRHPALTVLDRTIAFRSVKRMGRLLSPDGRGTGFVPMGPWTTGGGAPG